MSDTTKAEPRPLFTPSTLPQTEVPDPLVTFIEQAMLAIANRQEALSIQPDASWRSPTGAPTPAE